MARSRAPESFGERVDNASAGVGALFSHTSSQDSLLVRLLGKEHRKPTCHGSLVDPSRDVAVNPRCCLSGRPIKNGDPSSVPTAFALQNPRTKIFCCAMQ